MKVAVLLSAGRHPVSGDPVLPRLEAQAVRLATGLGEAFGLHAGPAAGPAADALGHGLGRLLHAKIVADADPAAALAAAIRERAPDVVLAGRRGQGGQETGLVPYALAAALGWPIVADAIGLAAGGEAGALVVEQALPKGAKRRLTVRRPAVVTVHPGAPAPAAYAFGLARRGVVERVEVAAMDAAGKEAIAVEERPYRRRPKLMRSAPAAGSAAERLAAATGAAAASDTTVMVDPAPGDAARAVLAHLRAIGVLAPAATRPE